MARQNGGIIGVANNPTGPASTNIAKGMWSLAEQAKHKKAGNWPTVPLSLQYFLVGGGGGGASSSSGGGGGYTTTGTVTAYPGLTYGITVGAGGPSATAGNLSELKLTGTFDYTANGGQKGATTSYNGGNGGSGGGGYAGGAGGSDGGNGATVSYAGGTGQGTTTRAFGDVGGTLYAGGGGAGVVAGGSGSGGAGGDGGGGAGSGNVSAGLPGTENTGGGGGAGGGNGGTGGQGGSGVILLKIPDNRSASFSGGVTQTSATASGYRTYTITAAGASDTVTFS